MRDLVPNKRILLFEPITPLFSDYAEKARFVYIPEEESAKYHEADVFGFPVGTAFIKNFYYSHDFRDESKGRKIIETRLLVKREEGWDALPYIWNDEQTEAFLEIAGGMERVQWIDMKGNEMDLKTYTIPNKNQCKGCHVDDGKFKPIGPKARNLNFEIEYADGKMNQLEKWKQMGFLSDAPEAKNAPKMADWDNPESSSLHDRALAYLEINCGTCHSPTGPANTSGLHLTTYEKNPANLGICKSSVAAGRGSGGFLYDIVPGKPDESILVFRMESTDPGIMMPELGRHLVHQEGVELVREWIAELEGGCGKMKGKVQ